MAKVTLKFVNSFTDRHGRERYYFRRRGLKAVPLEGDPTSEAFIAKYRALRDGDNAPAPIEIGARKTLPGTVNALAVAHYGSAYFKHLDLGTQAHRRRSIEQFRDAHGSKRVALVERVHIEVILKKIDKLSMQRHWLQAIRALFQSAVPAMRVDNPTAGITVELPKSDGHHTWLDDEVAQYRAHWTNGTEARLALEFALEAYSRRGEIVRLGRQHVKDGRISIARGKGSDDVDIEVTPELQVAIDAMPKTGHLPFFADGDGAPRTKKWLGHQFAKWAKAAGLPDRCRLHGLKKAGMTQGAHDGMSPYELMAQSGHRDIESVMIYTRKVDKRRLEQSAAAKRRAARTANG